MQRITVKLSLVYKIFKITCANKFCRKPNINILTNKVIINVKNFTKISTTWTVQAWHGITSTILLVLVDELNFMRMFLFINFMRIFWQANCIRIFWEANCMRIFWLARFTKILVCGHTWLIHQFWYCFKPV